MGIISDSVHNVDMNMYGILVHNISDCLNSGRLGCLN